MTDLQIPEPLATRLREAAARENRSITDLLDKMPDQPQTNEAGNDPYGAMLLRIAEMAAEAHLEFTDEDVIGRSREILETEYADYLLKRMRNETEEGSHD